MRLILVGLVTVMMLIGITSTSEALLRKDRDYYTGEIISVDKAANTIQIKDLNSRIERTFTLQKKWRADLKMDREVVVHAEKGTKIARSARVVKKEPVEKETMKKGKKAVKGSY